MALIRTCRLGAARPILPVRTFANSARLMAAGDLGGVRPGGEASADAFQKREKANEDYFIKKAERDKLQALKAKLDEQEKHIRELKKSIDEYTEGQGGEQH